MTSKRSKDAEKESRRNAQNEQTSDYVQRVFLLGFVCGGVGVPYSFHPSSWDVNKYFTNENYRHYSQKVNRQFTEVKANHG